MPALIPSAVLQGLLTLATGALVAAPAVAQTPLQLNLAAGFASRRLPLPDRVALQPTDDCGYVPAEPVAIVTLEEDFFFLQFSVLDATIHTTLLVAHLGNGDRFCSRGEMAQGGYWSAGTYAVYVGGMTELAALDSANADTLEISEQPSDVSDGN